MPLCVHCTHLLPHLYTVYTTAHNAKLEQCPSCLQLADPYITSDNFTVLFDLVLLKRSVYRHLIFNRGTPPRRGDAGFRKHDEDSAEFKAAEARQRERETAKARWALTLRVGFAVVFVDAFIRWSELRSHLTDSVSLSIVEESKAFARVVLGCVVETIAFHMGITVSSFVVLTAIDWNPARRASSLRSGIRQSLRYSHIPLCLLYSSIAKFFLLFLLALWNFTPSPSTPPLPPPHYTYTIDVGHPVLKLLWEALDDDKLDRQWVVRNVLGGMAAGFGLRVVLDCHPVFALVVILAGWAVKTGVASVVGGWIGKESSIGEAWLAYSIP